MTETERRIVAFHELGHAVHTLFAREHSLFTFHAPLPLAESASTFGEMILLDRFMAEADPATQTALRFKQLDDNYATILRQAYFAIFERDAHARVEVDLVVVHLE